MTPSKMVENRRCSNTYKPRGDPRAHTRVCFMPERDGTVMTEIMDEDGSDLDPSCAITREYLLFSTPVIVVVP